jgi:hypothetical protein
VIFVYSVVRKSSCVSPEFLAVGMLFITAILFNFTLGSVVRMGTSLRLITLNHLIDDEEVVAEIILESVMRDMPQARGGVSIQDIESIISEVESYMALPLWVHIALQNLPAAVRRSDDLLEPLATFMSRSLQAKFPTRRVTDEARIRSILSKWIEFCIEPLEFDLIAPPCGHHGSVAVLSETQGAFVVAILAEEERQRLANWANEIF